MMRGLMLGLAAVGAASAAGSLPISNGQVTAWISDAGLLNMTSKDGAVLLFSGDSWSVTANGTAVTPSACNAPTLQAYEGSELTHAYACAKYSVNVTYGTRPGGLFVQKLVSIKAGDEGDLSVSDVKHFEGTNITLSGGGQRSVVVQGNPYNRGLQTAAFIRWGGAATGAFVSVQNPYGTHQVDDSGMTVGYTQTFVNEAQYLGSVVEAEGAVLGFTKVSRYVIAQLTEGERRSFKRAVASFLLDSSSRAKGTVKVNVAWDENDYQIDVGTEEGRTEYKRIIDRNSQFGVTHIVYEPRNTLHSSRFNTTDGWGWEGSLWMAMGELMREGKWDPRTDALPADIQGMVDYASGKGVKLMGYVYPCLPFVDLKQYWAGSGPNTVNLGAPQVQEYYIEVMNAFLQKTGSGGFAWDHDIFAGPGELRYGQWRGWMRILAAVRAAHPDIVMDHRQTAHAWGVWYQLAGSYTEPIAGDENPETYGVPINTLSTDHVAGDNTRRVNYVYSTAQLIPQERVPGFVFHQSERTDDDGTFYCTKGTHNCFNNSNTRDFDFMGYKYSVLSTVGTAGLNNVLTMIPARDPAEFELLPQDDIAFVHDWLAWTDTNQEQLRNTEWIALLGSPGPGGVDGTHAMPDDLDGGKAGYVFLFNPALRPGVANLTVDESIGLPSSGSFEVTELYPLKGHAVGQWNAGEKVSVTVMGSDARVLSIKRAAPAPVRVAHAEHIRAHAVVGADGTIEVEAKGVGGKELVKLQGAAAGASVRVNGKECGMVGQAGHVHIEFEGYDAIPTHPPISGDVVPASFTGGWFNTSFTIPVAVREQLEARAKAYPVPWTYSNEGCGLPHCVDDSKATWLIPTRLLMNPYIAGQHSDLSVRLWIDGSEVKVQQSFNSRGRVEDRTFVGSYFDATSLLPTAGKAHTASLLVDKVGAGAFQGVYWWNVDAVWTNQVRGCTAA